ncbi:hypothetical protein GL218_05142 [Daldinia childiae]|uniref:uncharacterized protein n=1 Tax=Daldinia childiae TaxID=326645 RepID=UPI00144627B7|nr:uncharacterized protein GL218_05142 [Daldinia childiae]KAF3059350.1 hypothetical protein GL218_05142 [Daldinia childiae]
MSGNPQGEEPPRDPPGEPSGPSGPSGRPRRQDPPAFRGIPALIPGVDYPVFYPRAGTGHYDAAFYSAPPQPSQQPSQQQSQLPANAEETPIQTLQHFPHYYGCYCIDCVRFYHPSNYLARGTHGPTGPREAHHPGPASVQPQAPVSAQAPASNVYALDRAGLEALNRQAHDYVFQTAASHGRNVRVPQMQYQQPQIQSGPASAQVAVQGQHQGQQPGPSQSTLKANHPHFNEKELKELKEYRERKEREQREERVRRFREQNERAIGFHESDDEEFIPNIRNP